MRIYLFLFNSVGLSFPSCVNYHHNNGSAWIIVTGGRGTAGAPVWNKAVNYYDITLDLGWRTLEPLPTVVVYSGQSQLLLLNKYELYIPNTHSTYGIMRWDYKSDKFERIAKNMSPLKVTYTVVSLVKHIIHIQNVLI